MRAALRELDSVAHSTESGATLNLFPYLWSWSDAIKPDELRALWPTLSMAIKDQNLKPFGDLTNCLVYYEVVSLGLAMAPPLQVEPLARRAIVLREKINYAGLTPTVLHLRFCLARILFQSHKFDESRVLLTEYLTDLKKQGGIDIDPDRYSYSLRLIGHIHFIKKDLLQCQNVAAELKTETKNPYDKMDGAYLTALCAWRQQQTAIADENFRMAMQWREITPAQFRDQLAELPSAYEKFRKERQAAGKFVKGPYR